MTRLWKRILWAIACGSAVGFGACDNIEGPMYGMPVDVQHDPDAPTDPDSDETEDAADVPGEDPDTE